MAHGFGPNPHPDRDGETRPASVCPLCESTQTNVSFEKLGYGFVDCQRCGHRFTGVAVDMRHVATVYDDRYFSGEGEYPDYLAEAGDLRERGEWYRKLLASRIRSGTILDVGAAGGFILETFLESGWRGRGIEPNASMAAAARTRGVPVDVGILEDLKGDRSFDLIAMIEVIHHFIDLRAALAAAASATAPGGYWLIETWNYESWTARLLGKGWHGYNPPSVLHYFTPARLAALVSQYGLSPVAHGRPPKSVSGMRAKAILSRGADSLSTRATALLTRALPDTLRVPYPGDDVFWTLFRRTDTDVAKRPRTRGMRHGRSRKA